MSPAAAQVTGTGGIGPRIAVAPISWGVCEVEGWGWQAPPGDVLEAIRSAGARGTELGPEGWLGATVDEAGAALAAARLDLVGGFVTALLHVPDRLAGQMLHVDRQARMLRSCGADTLVLALATGSGDYEQHVRPDDQAWAAALDAIDVIVDSAAHDHGLTVAVHPHVGTLIEHSADVHRVLTGTRAGLCLDTGHLTLGGVDPLAIARVWADRIVHVHLKDVDHGCAELVDNGEMTYADAVRQGLYVKLGTGDAEVAKVVCALEASGYRGWYVLEHDVRLASPGDLPPIALRVADDVSFVRQLCQVEGPAG